MSETQQKHEEFLMAMHRKISSRMLGYILPYEFITPNLITSISNILALLSAFLLAFGIYTLNVIAIIIFLFSITLDTLDGDLARARNEGSKYGAWYDGVSDRLKFLAVITGLTIGLPFMFWRIDLLFWSTEISKWFLTLACFSAYIMSQYVNTLAEAIWGKSIPNNGGAESNRSLQYLIRLHVLNVGFKDQYLIAIFVLLDMSEYSLLAVALYCGGAALLLFAKKTLVDRVHEQNLRRMERGVAEDLTKAGYSLQIPTYLAVCLLIVVAAWNSLYFAFAIGAILMTTAFLFAYLLIRKSS